MNGKNEIASRTHLCRIRTKASDNDSRYRCTAASFTASAAIRCSIIADTAFIRCLCYRFTCSIFGFFLWLRCCIYVKLLCQLLFSIHGHCKRQGVSRRRHIISLLESKSNIFGFAFAQAVNLISTFLHIRLKWPRVCILSHIRGNDNILHLMIRMIGNNKFPLLALPHLIYRNLIIL